MQKLLGHRVYLAGPMDRVKDRGRTWRNKISEKNNVPAYVVVNNQSLIELVKLKELSELSFLNINGLGKIKFQLYYKQIKNIFDNYKKSI